MRVSSQDVHSARIFNGCTTVVTVDTENGVSCDSPHPDSWSDLNGSVCRSLQDVLDILNGSDSWSEPHPADCVEVYLMAGEYEVTGAGVLSGVSLILRGEYSGTETFTDTGYRAAKIGTQHGCCMGWVPGIWFIAGIAGI